MVMAFSNGGKRDVVLGDKKKKKNLTAIIGNGSLTPSSGYNRKEWTTKQRAKGTRRG